MYDLNHISITVESVHTDLIRITKNWANIVLFPHKSEDCLNEMTSVG